MTLNPLRVNIQIREYLGNGKYGPGRSITVYNLSRDEVVNIIKPLFKTEEDNT